MKKLMLWALVACGACVAPQPVIRPPAGDDVTVFIHGYRGGFLSQSDGSLAWLTVGAALEKGERSLAFPFEGQRDFPRFGPLVPAGPMTKLTAIPGIIEEDAYATWMDWAKDALPGFIAYSYDWRLDLRESGATFCTFLEKLGPTRRVRIVAHSMGGMVTLQCLRHGPDAVRAKVTKVVYVGTPFRGSPGQWDDLHLGTRTSSNVALMGPEALLTFPSSWALLGPTQDFLFDAQGAPVPLEIFTAQTWVDRKWGLFKEPLPPAYRAQLEARLKARTEFWAGFGDLDGPPPTWKTMAVVGKGRPTVRGWTVNADGTFDFAHPLMGDGDGVVLASHTHPPKPMSAIVVESTGEHSGMLREKAVQSVIADFLRD
jgi:pimeloyl-ACP methyl ester carboxylesterase